MSTSVQSCSPTTSSENNNINNKIIFEPFKNFPINGLNVENGIRSGIEEDYIILKAMKEDFEDLHEFMLNDFLQQEPLNAALDVSRTEANEFFAEIINSTLEDGISYLVRRKGPIDNGKLVAVRLTSILNRPQTNSHQINEEEEEQKEKPPKYGIFESVSKLPKILQIKAFLNHLESQTWNLLPIEVNKLASWLVLSVDSNFKRRGIGRKLIHYNLDELKNIGCQGIVTEATAFNSQELFSKEGYQRLFELYHTKWLDENGKQIFKCKDATCKATLEYKPL